MLERSPGVPDTLLRELMSDFESTTEEAIRRRRTNRSPILTEPRPGSFYQIQWGKGGLLTTAGLAYGVGPGGERLRYAQRISRHPLNRALLVPPSNAYERKYFPSGLVSFLKRFTCTVPQRRATGGEKRCYGVIWIPPREGGSPFTPRVTILRRTKLLGVEGTAHRLIKKLGSGPFCERWDLDLVVGPDDRVRVDDDHRTRAPFRWTCKVLAIYPSDRPGDLPVAQASGVLLTRHLMATNAHVLSTDMGVPEALIVIPGFSKAHPAQSTALDKTSAPLGIWLVRRRKPGGDSNFHIAPEFRSVGDEVADYATVDLRGAQRIGGLPGAPPDGWLTVDLRLALSAPQAANPLGEDSPIETIDESDPVPTRQLIRRVGADRLRNTGYPVDRICEMMLATDRVRPLEPVCRIESGREICFVEYPDTDNHALIGSRLDATFGNSGGPVWVERVVRRREGTKLRNRRQYVLAGLQKSVAFHVTQRIDFDESTPKRYVLGPEPPLLLLPNHTSTAVVVLTPFVLKRLRHPSLMLPA